MGNLFHWLIAKHYIEGDPQYYSNASTGAQGSGHAGAFAHALRTAAATMDSIADQRLFWNALVNSGAISGPAEWYVTGNATLADREHAFVTADANFMSLTADPGFNDASVPAPTVGPQPAPAPAPEEEPIDTTLDLEDEIEDVDEEEVNEPPPETPPPVDYHELAKINAPWLPDELLDVYAEAWANGASPAGALAAVRADPAYETYYPGNKREDGSIRYDEIGYVLYRREYNDILGGYQLGPEHFGVGFQDLLSGEVSVNEFRQRMDAAWTGIVGNIDAVKQYYAANFGIEMSDAAIMGSLIDPGVESAILERRMTIAQIGGEGLNRGFNVGVEWVGDLAAAGVQQQQAQQFFGAAQVQLPLLGNLAQRHRDFDPTFDIEELGEANLLSDATQRQRISRLLGAESSTFTGRERRVARQGEELTGLEVR